MKTVLAHYENHLGPVYAWMLGDIQAAFARSTAELDDLQLPSLAGGVVDLGAGLGLHTLPLAERGYSVTAIDTCQLLLDDRRSRSGTLPIIPINADIQSFRTHWKRPIDVILYMGDTLTHLSDIPAVEALLAAVAVSLAKGGVFATTFRDYASTTLEGDDRFILVHSDENKILTCILEYGDHTVTVHDLLHRREDGQWRLRESSYRKLRLSPECVASILRLLGLVVRREPGPSGMVRIVGTKV